MVGMCGYGFMCAIGLVGAFEGAPIGFVNIWEAYVFGLFHGFFLGPIQSYSRALFASMVPKGEEATLFAIYGLTDKGSSWLGPLIAGAIAQATGNVRLTFVYLLAMIVFSMYLLKSVDQAQGIADASRGNQVEGAEEEDSEGSGNPLVVIESDAVEYQLAQAVPLDAEPRSEVGPREPFNYG
ncbi:vacuole effluxer Atg22 like-domain-containing protein [Baffinella frigidus]|nr:vacuole effluxer Atg22 like-domain-containing protein [Cryptophyta sp. CCMP2293]